MGCECITEKYHKKCDRCCQTLCCWNEKVYKKIKGIDEEEEGVGGGGGGEARQQLWLQKEEEQTKSLKQSKFYHSQFYHSPCGERMRKDNNKIKMRNNCRDDADAADGTMMIMSITGLRYRNCIECGDTVDLISKHYYFEKDQLYICSEVCIIRYNNNNNNSSSSSQIDFNCCRKRWSSKLPADLLVDIQWALIQGFPLNPCSFILNSDCSKCESILSFLFEQDQYGSISHIIYELLKFFVSQHDSFAMHLLSDKLDLDKLLTRQQSFDLFISSAADGNVGTFTWLYQLLAPKYLILDEEGATATVRKPMFRLLKECAQYGHLEIFQHLVERYDVSKELIMSDEKSGLNDENVLLKISACGGHLEMVKYLVENFGLEFEDVRVRINFIVVASEEYGHHKVSEYLRQHYLIEEKIDKLENFTNSYLVEKVCKNICRKRAAATAATTGGGGILGRDHKNKKRKVIIIRHDEEYFYIVPDDDDHSPTATTTTTTTDKFSFNTYDTELDIENGSKEFDEFRVGKISASRIGPICGVSEYSTPKAAALKYFKKFDMNDDCERGIIMEQFIRQILFQKTDWRMPMRKCGIFHWKDTRYSAMPDDIGYVPSWGKEIIIEYKCPRIAKTIPKLDYIFQTNWQMGIVGLKHALLVYDAVRGNGIPTFGCWHIEFSKELFNFQRVCAVEFCDYLKCPCSETLPETPWIYHRFQDALKNNLWLPGHKIKDLPAAPKIKKLDDNELRKLFFT